MLVTGGMIAGGMIAGGGVVGGGGALVMFGSFLVMLNSHFSLQVR